MNTTPNKLDRKMSIAAFAAAQAVIPGGVDSPVRAFKSIDSTPFFIRKGAGPYFWDVDDNRFLDYCLSWGVHILGHNHPTVIEAVTKTIANGCSYGAPTELETQLAQAISKCLPSIEKIRFVSSGTEAVMSAIRLARGFTKRKLIVKFDGCYHGHADHLLVSAGSGVAELTHSSSAGVPEEFASLTISIPFNDITLIEKVFADKGSEIAAVIVEPVPANMGVILPIPGFLQKLRELTSKHVALLIFDEVITGFRIGLSGAQGYFGITPDLTTLGKIIGGGFPVGAFGGRAEIMDQLAPLGPVYQAGTLSGNPVAMSAGLAVIKTLGADGFYANLNKLADRFITKLKIIGEEKGFVVNSWGSMFTIFMTTKPAENYLDVQNSDIKRFVNFYLQLLEQGIYCAPSAYEANFISGQHCEALLEETLTAIGNSSG